MFSIKICGITTPDDGLACAAAGADALGMNFYEKSSRYITPQKAAEIGGVVAGKVQKVGVFVNLPACEVNEVATIAELDWAQLHGNEPPEMLIDLDSTFRILRVYRFQPGDDQRIATDLQRCEKAGRLPDAVLLDAPAKGQFGGSGESIDWSSLHGDRPWLQGLPLVLAGGLKPENVFEAVKAVRPAAVDVASGVESAPGVKSAELVAQFIQDARRGLDS